MSAAASSPPASPGTGASPLASAIASGDGQQPEIAVVRQPISDARRNVVGYELLFDADRHGTGAGATSAMLLDAFGDIGLEQLVGSHPAWITVTTDFLEAVGTPPVRPDRAILQLRAEPVGDRLLGTLQQLARTGYALALAGFAGQRGLTELLALCSIVKLDVTGLHDADLRAAMAGPAASGALLTATGVETHEDFERCRGLGFTYFQGAFFAAPRAVRHRGVATSGVGTLRDLNRLTSGEMSFEALEDLIASDVGLALKLLRYVNSAFFALPRTIGSVREALAMLGVRTVTRWATVMALSSLPDVPHELLALALQRARMCETLAAAAASPADRERYFTVGLFSVVDALLGRPMDEVLEALPFDDEVQGALLRHEGAKGQLLAAVIAYERGEFPQLPAAHANGTVTLASAYREALDWAAAEQRTAA